jgi:CheY-like chemotaxis protein
MNIRGKNKPILLIEDDSVDAMTVRRALNELHVANPLVLAENGEDALAYLQDSNNERPCIILLDLNMPIMNGLEFLRIVKADSGFKRFPVIVLTTSDEEDDKLDSFNLGVAGYIRKPVEYLKFVEIMQTIDFYWTVSEVPA